MHPPVSHNQEALSKKQTGLLIALDNLVGQRAGDGAEGVADLGSEQTHNSDDDDGDEGEDNRVLDEALAFFFRCKQHDIISFLIKSVSEARPQSYIKYTRFPENFKPAIMRIQLQVC